MKIKFLLIALSLLPISGRADEGMWLPSKISTRIADMQAKGLNLTAEDIYSVNQSSLKDAVVLFGRGCTGELISSEGLLITNHHCGYGQIQRHSSVEHDYLKDGFWAMNMEEELPNPELSVSFLDYMEDVTDQVLKGYKPNMSEIERIKLVDKNSERIIDKALKGKKHYSARVTPLYNGNQYFLYVYRVYKDVRLVGAPPSAVGKFGGDTDNWMWPRHTGDFSIFRIYVDKNNNPAEYSEDNVPYTPKKYLPISTTGVNEGDFTFIYGFPGTTREYITSDAVRYITQISNPVKIGLRTMILDIQKKYMNKDQAVRIQYSSKNASVANAWKKWQGEVLGVEKNDIVLKKTLYQNKLKAWAKGGKYENVVDSLQKYELALEPYALSLDYYSEAINPIELPRFARLMVNRLNDGEDVSSYVENFYKDYYIDIDKEVFIALVSEYLKSAPEEFIPEFIREEYAKYETVQQWCEAIYTNSKYLDKDFVLEVISDWKNRSSELLSDPAYIFAESINSYYLNTISPRANELKETIALFYRDYMKAMMEYEPNRQFYPDANLTLRVAYGQVAGYRPSDAVQYLPVSTLEGIIQKDNPEIFDYNIPQELRDVYESKDFGRWELNGSVPVCFIATNHTTGGNSGSPIINSNGELIGVNFDRVWEGTMSDIAFDPEICRNISLDIRYVLFYIEKVAGAGHLLKEMDIR